MYVQSGKKMHGPPPLPPKRPPSLDEEPTRIMSVQEIADMLEYARKLEGVK